MKNVLSFGGSGHLLVYQLGVAVRLAEIGSPRINAWSGSSGGAIVATACAALWPKPDLLVDFSQQLLATGDAFMSLRRLLKNAALPKSDTLYVCVTECKTGEPKLLSNFENQEQLLRAVLASCTIPASAHPFDLLQSGLCYPEDQGILLPRSCLAACDAKIANQTDAYVDGGLSAAIPPLIPGAHRTISVSPIAGPSSSVDHICPSDTSLRIPFIGAPRLAGSPAYISLDNVRAAFLALLGGSPEALRAWYESGLTQATRCFTK